MSKNKDFYHTVIEIASDYLGPAAPRFIDRHIKSHLKKEPTDLMAEDLEDLIKWTKASMSLLTSNQEIVNEFAQRMTALTSKNGGKVKA